MDEFPGETKGTRMVAIHTRHRTYKLQAESAVMAEWIEKIHEAIRVRMVLVRFFFFFVVDFFSASLLVAIKAIMILVVL
jgi:hypothetical protein